MIKLPNLKYSAHVYYSLVFLISWTSWFLSAHFSYQIEKQLLTLTLAFLGLLGPMLAALIMMLLPHNRLLLNDYYQRLFHGFSISLRLSFIMITIILVSLVVATLISLWFGFSSNQFNLSSNFLMMLPFAFVAAAFEELGWRTYGMDSLLKNSTLLSASLRFTILWGLWHLPLFFINQTYQHSLYQLGPLYVMNFFVSVLPATFLSNWFYYQNNRSIPVAILFHFILVASSEFLQTEPQTKWIITLLLLSVCLIIIACNRTLFISKII